jgi:hypothetical protein
MEGESLKGRFFGKDSTGMGSNESMNNFWWWIFRHDGLVEREDTVTSGRSMIMSNMPQFCLFGIHFAFGPYAVPVSLVNGVYKIEIVGAPEMNMKEIHEISVQVVQ